MSNVINKVKQAVQGNTTSGSAPEGTYGPHSSRMANAADPRIDSDADHRATGRMAGHGEYGTGTGTGYTGTTAGTTMGSHGLHNASGPGPATHTAGPHSSNLANKVDPLVDSDMSNTRHAGGAYGTSTGVGGMTGTNHGTHTAGTGMGGMTGTNHGTHTAGTGTGMGLGSTHRTGAAGTTTFGAGSGTTGITGTHGAPEGTYGPHSSRVANAADPRIDSDRDGRANVTAAAPGPAPNTAGPHKQDILNKLDPRVDSDMDGSKTIGGNRTYQ